MFRLVRWFWHDVVLTLSNEVGGGSKPTSPTFITPPPPQITQAPPPNVGETSRQLFESQLAFNPQLTQQAVQLSGQYGPQLAQQQYALQQQYGPMYRALYEQMFPTQTQGFEQLAQQANQRFLSPQGLTPEQLAAQEAIRQRGREQVSRNIRAEANLGGGLFGGRRELREDRSLGELEQGYAIQDIALQDQRRAQALQELIAAGQVIFPQVQQPGVPQFGQGVTPSPDALLQAILSGQIVQQPVYQPGNPGSPGYFQSTLRGLGGQSPTFY